MHLTKLSLEEFRSYARFDLELPPAGIRIAGRNASGKTSLLEAIVMLATTRSPRTITERETVRWESGQDFGVAPYARISAEVEVEHRLRSIGISLELPVGTTRIARKQFRVDGRSVRAHDMVGVLRTVLFSPEDVQLVTGPPAERRRQIDILISQIDRGYLRSLSRYGKVVSQRNGLLKAFSRDRVDPGSQAAVAQLSFWDEELIGAGSAIVAARITALARLSGFVAERSHALIADRTIGLHYQPRLDLPEWSAEEKADRRLLEQRVQAGFLDHLRRIRSEEFRRGVTVIGPQRDDFLMTLDGRPLEAYGSRGQQRLGVIALKLSENDLIKERTGERPVVLLDDVLSELDEVHRDLLLNAIAAEQCQVLVTSAERASLDHPALERLPFMEISNGAVASGLGA
jgi:DNA replication and repair protein RecF